jgi:hypothetical protein
MQTSHFLKLLTYTVGICLVLVGCMLISPLLKQHIIFALLTIVLFSLLSIVIFIFGEKLSKSKNKYLYNNLIVINFILKIVFSVLLILAYVNVTKPVDNWFLGVFIIIYVLFTSFEVLFMTKQARLKS